MSNEYVEEVRRKLASHETDPLQVLEVQEEFTALRIACSLLRPIEQAALERYFGLRFGPPTPTVDLPERDYYFRQKALKHLRQLLAGYGHPSY